MNVARAALFSPELAYAALAETLSTPLAEARALPAACYTDPTFHAVEKQAIFEHEWLSVAHVSQLKEPGDFVAIDVLNEPLLVIRARDGAIRVLSRVCQHRGLDIKPPSTRGDGCGNTPALRCPYHLWVYDLTGRLVAAPEMTGSACHARDEVRLREFRHEISDGFVFVTFNPNARPLADSFSALSARYLARYGLGEAQLVWQRHWDCGFNWKVLAENFMEPYHHLGAHRTTLQPFLPARHCFVDTSDDQHLAVRLPLRADIQERLRASGNPEPGFVPFPNLTIEDHIDWWVFLAYPTFLLFLAPDRAYWYRLLPTGPESCSLTTTLLVAANASQAPDYAAQLARAEQETIAFHLEDMEVCSAVQRGFRSRGYTRGALSPLEEPLLHIQRYLARRMGAADVDS